MRPSRLRLWMYMVAVAVSAAVFRLVIPLVQILGWKRSITNASIALVPILAVGPGFAIAYWRRSREGRRVR